MTATAITSPPPDPGPEHQRLGQRLAWGFSDALALTRRNLLRYVRVPALVVFATIQPVMFVLLFRYVFGGAIRTPGNSYVNYLMPGIIVQTAAFGSFTTAVGLADDLSKGVIDRFRAMPIARSAVLVGRLASDTVRNLFVVLLMVAVGYAVGFRIHQGIIGAVGLVVVSLVFGFAISCISAFIGLAVKDPESVQSFGFIWLFPLVFASGIFVPVPTMPGWLQAFAKPNPFTVVTQAIRGLAEGGPVAVPLVQGLAWSTGILVVFGWLAVRTYRRAV